MIYVITNNYKGCSVDIHAIRYKSKSPDVCATSCKSKAYNKLAELKECADLARELYRLEVAPALSEFHMANAPTPLYIFTEESNSYLKLYRNFEAQLLRDAISKQKHFTMEDYENGLSYYNLHIREIKEI